MWGKKTAAVVEPTREELQRQQSEELQRQQNLILRERDELQAKLDQARAELEAAKKTLEQLAGVDRAQALATRDSIDLLEIRIAALTKAIDEKSAKNQELQNQIRPIHAELAYRAHHEAEIALAKRIAANEAEQHRLLKALEETRTAGALLVAERNSLFQARPRGVL